MIETVFNDDVLESQISSCDKIDFALKETAEQTIQRVLSAYEIGQKLRQLRSQEDRAGRSRKAHRVWPPCCLSWRPAGCSDPAYAGAYRDGFRCGARYFFDDSRRGKTFTVVRKGDRIQFPERPDSPVPAYYFECLAFSAQEKGMQAYLAEFPPRKPEECRVICTRALSFSM